MTDEIKNVMTAFDQAMRDTLCRADGGTDGEGRKQSQ